MPSPYNNSGRVNNRNYDKPFRFPRTKETKDGKVVYKDMEFVKGPLIEDKDTGELRQARINSTGCFGVKSHVGRGTPPHVLAVGTSKTRGKAHNIKRRKLDKNNIGHRVTKGEAGRIERLKIEKALKRRNYLFSKIFCGHGNSQHKQEFRQLNFYLGESLSQAEWDALMKLDEHRRKSLRGRMKKKG